MFPMAHLWLLERVVGRPSPAHYVGCVWPDMLFGSPLTHSESHMRGAELLAYARRRLADGAPDAAEFMDFVWGAITHGSNPHGFDWFSDEQWGDDPSRRGYAFQRGGVIADETAAACDVAQALGLWKAHNIVEMSFELSLYAGDPGLADRFAAASEDAGMRERLATALAGYYTHPASVFHRAMGTFAEWWVRPSSGSALAAVYARQVRTKHEAQAPNEAAIAALIERAVTLTAPDREDYLTTCVTRVGDLLTTLAVL
jgi:hypothetical protein